MILVRDLLPCFERNTAENSNLDVANWLLPEKLSRRIWKFSFVLVSAIFFCQSASACSLEKNREFKDFDLEVVADLIDKNPKNAAGQLIRKGGTYFSNPMTQAMLGAAALKQQNFAAALAHLELSRLGLHASEICGADNLRFILASLSFYAIQSISNGDLSLHSSLLSGNANSDLELLLQDWERALLCLDGIQMDEKQRSINFDCARKK